MSLLAVRRVAKPWGRDVLPAPFVAPQGQRIGEVWFEPPPDLPSLLVKYLFTGEKLSVQVHPGGEGGKEECWLVIAAEPGAALGIGFREPLSSEAMRKAALDGSIEELLEWFPVAPGDFFYIPAGTVHAVGAGVSLIEVQQTSEITYRLYDYGRPRELHLEEGIAVAKGEPHSPGLRRTLPAAGELQLVDGPHFRLDRVEGPPSPEVARRYIGPLLVIPLSGGIEVAGELVGQGQCALANAGEEIAIAPNAQCLLAQPLASDAGEAA